LAWKCPSRAYGLPPGCSVSCPIQSHITVSSARGGWFYSPFTRVWWLCRGHGAADDQTYHARGVMADEKVQVCIRWFQQFDLPLVRPTTEIQKGKMFPEQNLPALLQKCRRHPDIYFGNSDAVESMSENACEAAGQNLAATSEKQGWIPCSLSCLGKQ